MRTVRTVLAVAVVLLTGCGSVERAPRSGDVGQTSATAGIGSTTATPGLRSQEIYIDSVTVQNPLIVYGRARTFENTVQVRARDDQGGEIAEVFTTSVGEMGNHNPFVASVWLTRPPGSQVIVESFEYSANDGSVRSLIADTIAFPVPSSIFIVDFPG